MKSYEINKILVPVDFSTLANNAISTAVAMSKRQLATITLMYVVENAFALFPPDAGGVSSSVLDQLVKDANENLGNLARDLRVTHDVVVNHIVQSGNPATEICRWARQKEIDLIVMGTHGSSGLREFIMGSNAYRVVKNAPCPVLTLPGHHQWLDFKKVLFPVRMLPQALDKYEVVRPIVQKNGASMLVAGVVKNNDSHSLVEMKELVDILRNQISEDDVVCGSEVHYCDNPSQQVLEIANHNNPDLIAITAMQDSSVREFFFGPYAQHIVNHAKVPVLSIKPRPELESPGELEMVTESSMGQKFAIG